MISKEDTLSSHLINLRGLDSFLPIATQIAIAQIVSHNINDIGLVFTFAACG